MNKMRTLIYLTAAILLMQTSAFANLTGMSDILEAEVIAPMEGKNSEDAFHLKITTKTGDSGMPPKPESVKAYISLNGDSNEEKQLEPYGGKFVPGEENNFRLQFIYPLEDITSLVLRVTGNADWQCDEITFQFEKDDEKSRPYTFDSEMWFAGKESHLDKLGAIDEKHFIFTPVIGESSQASNEKMPPPVTVTFASEKELTFIKAAPSKFSFKITNTSSDFLIIRNVAIKDQLPDINRWYGSQYGSTLYDDKEDRWEYDSMQQQLSDPVFAFGVLAPENTLEVTQWAIAKEGKLPIAINFQRLTKAQALEHFYVNTSGDSVQSATYAHAKNVQSLLENKNIDWKNVIIPNLDEIEMTSYEAKLDVKLMEFGFRLEDARKMMGEEIVDYVFWMDENVWIVKTTGGTYLAAANVLQPMPEIDLLSFILIAKSNDFVPTLLPLEGYESFNPAIPKIEGPGYFNPGTTKIQKTDLAALFEYAREKKDKITILNTDLHGLGTSQYLIVGECNMKERRKIAHGENIPSDPNRR